MVKLFALDPSDLIQMEYKAKLAGGVSIARYIGRLVFCCVLVKSATRRAALNNNSRPLSFASIF